MYEELIKRLRNDATAFVGFVGEDLREAADSLDNLNISVKALADMVKTDSVKNSTAKTNADRIRAMSDEELADELLEWFACFMAVEWSRDMILDLLKQEEVHEKT